MASAILKALRWYMLVLGAIVGASAFMISNKTGAVLPMILVVLGFGVVYIMSYFWKEFRGKVMLYSFAVFLALTFASPYAPILLYYGLGINIVSYSIYFVWALTVGVLGIPVMSVVFKYNE